MWVWWSVCGRYGGCGGWSGCSGYGGCNGYGGCGGSGRSGGSGGCMLVRVCTTYTVHCTVYMYVKTEGIFNYLNKFHIDIYNILYLKMDLFRIDLYILGLGVCYYLS